MSNVASVSYNGDKHNQARHSADVFNASEGNILKLNLAKVVKINYDVILTNTF